MDRQADCAIEILFETREDGRFYAHSPDLPGFHMASKDLKAMRADFEPAIRDLVAANTRFAVDKIQFVPALESITTQYDRGAKREVCFVTLKRGG